MKKSILFLLGVVHFLIAANLTELEYFIDTDPGFGNGISMPLDPGETVAVDFVLDLDAVPVGFHNLNYRVQDEGGIWSLTHSLPFFKAAETTIAEDLAITTVEYFLDDDPGIGNAAQIETNHEHNLIEQIFLDLQDLPDGFYNLFTRVKDENGSWSMTHMQPVYFMAPILSPADLYVTHVEYFIDEDPGFGNGTVVQVNGVHDFIGVVELDLPDIETGFHMLHVRTKDAQGRWSATHSSPVYMEQTADTQNLVALDYSFSGEEGEVISHSFQGFVPATDLSFDLDINLSELDFGHPYSLQITARDAMGLSSLTYHHTFEIDTSDCAGVLGGDAVEDDCGICSGGTTDHTANSDKDCYGTCFGTAFIDDCDECVGGNTGLAEDWAKDCQGVCFGTAILDCAGNCNGGAVFDVCGICAGGSSGIQLNTCDGIMDDGMCDGAFSGPDFDGCGVCFGTDFVDECGECNGNGWDMCDDDDNGISNIDQYGHGAYAIEVVDTPEDQGGWVFVTFHRSIYDTDPLATRVPEAYYIQLLDEDWVTVSTTAAIAEDTYTVLAHTLSDSTSVDNAIRAYRIIASMEEGDFESVDIGFGYSVDNLHPHVPGGLLASANFEGPDVGLTWDAPVDDDFQYFSIYRDGELIGYSVESYFQDILPTFGEAYYTVTATDTHENESPHSDEAIAVIGIKGDTDFNFEVNVSDIVLMIAIILEPLTPTPYQWWAGDLDENGIINILDIVEVVGIIFEVFGREYDPITDALLHIGQGILRIESSGEMAGVQLDLNGIQTIYEVVLPEGWESHFSNGRFLAFNSSGESISGSPVIIHYDGNVVVESVILADWHGNSVEPVIEIAPERFSLEPPYPNPFNPETRISFSLPESGQVKLLVYNMLGEQVDVLEDAKMDAGQHLVTWNASGLASGNYFIRLESEHELLTRAVQLVK